MNKVIELLSNLEDQDFKLLESYISIARGVRDTLIKHDIEEGDLAEILKVRPEDMAAIKNGAYNFDLRFISNLQAYNEKMAAEKVKKEVQAEGIQFANYKYNFPIYLTRIEELITLFKERFPSNECPNYDNDKGELKK